MQLLTRRVNTNDPQVVSTLAYLQKKCLPQDRVYDVTKGWWWIVYADNIPIGFAGLVRSLTWFDCGYLCRAGVLSAYRGHGIQKKLIAVRIRKAKQVGYKWLISDTRDNHPSANNLAEFGFRMFDPTKPWGYNDTLYWRKCLNADQRPRDKKAKTKAILEKILREKQKANN